MRIFPKIKSIKKIYLIKTKIQKQKRFLRDIKFLFNINTPIKFIIKYIYNHFLFINNDIDAWIYYEKLNFIDNDWFVEKTPILINYFEKNMHEKKRIIDVLEIGSYEGRSSVFFLNYFDNINLSCVDTWEGSDEHDKKIMQNIEKNFDYNTKKNSAQLRKFKNNSDDFFKKNNELYDLIYIDGSHHYEQVIKDSINSDKFLRLNGFLLFDDYNFIYGNYDKNKNAASAINSFLENNQSKYEIIYIYNQVLLKKKY